MSRETLLRAIPSPVWTQVVTLADHQCQCREIRCHVPARDRCKATTSSARLVVAPTDPTTPDHAAWRLSVEALSAWCIACHATSRRRGEAARAASAREAGRTAQGTLFMILAEMPAFAAMILAGAR